MKKANERITNEQEEVKQDLKSVVAAAVESAYQAGYMAGYKEACAMAEKVMRGDNL